MGWIRRQGNTHPFPPDRPPISLGLLCAPLAAVAGLAQTVPPAIEAAIEAAGVPDSFVGLVRALLLPEDLAATRAALRDRMQTSLIPGCGSAMASIGLTIPVIAAAAIWPEGPLLLGPGASRPSCPR